MSLALVCVALNVNWLRAQVQTSPAIRPAFDVASVKPNKSGPGLVRIGSFQGRFSATNVTLRMLLRNAYGLQDFRMSGGPSWIDSERFDIEAKADGIATPQQVQAMLRTLLEERFKLNAKTETRELPVYALVMARNDGRLGGQLRRAGAECLAIRTWPGAPAPPPPPPGPPPATRDGPQCGSMLVQGNVSGRKMTMERLATMLSPWVNRSVLDRTNLAGNFDLDLQWAPDQMPTGPFGAPPGVPIDPNGPSLFTALQEQLGLKLDSQRGPVEVLVIESAERPTED
jgi:uncharacterized protein (TIGR03435 family)